MVEQTKPGRPSYPRVKRHIAFLPNTIPMKQKHRVDFSPDAFPQDRAHHITTHHAAHHTSRVLLCCRYYVVLCFNNLFYLVFYFVHSFVIFILTLLVRISFDLLFF